MKNQFSKWIAPALVVAFAISGAFATHAMNQTKGAAVLTQGYIWHAPKVCEPSDMCNEGPGIACTVGGNQLFALDSTGECQTYLSRP